MYPNSLASLLAGIVRLAQLGTVLIAVFVIFKPDSAASARVNFEIPVIAGPSTLQIVDSIAQEEPSPDGLGTIVSTRDDGRLASFSVAVPQTGASRTALCAIVVLCALWSLFVLNQLHGLLAAIGRGTPFLHNNVKHIRWLGFAVLAQFFGGPMLSWLVMAQVGHVTLLGSDFGVLVGRPGTTPFELGTLFMALTLFVLAEVFSQALTVWEEHQATV